MPENTTPSTGTDTEAVDELQAILDHYGPEIFGLFGTAYFGEPSPSVHAPRLHRPLLSPRIQAPGFTSR